MPTLKKAPKKQSRKITRESRSKVYTSSQWQRLRRAKLLMQPLCEVCLSRGIVTPAEDVHHDKSFITDAGVDYNLAYSIDNLISLCKKCHSEIHSKQGKTQGGLKEWLSQG